MQLMSIQSPSCYAMAVPSLQCQRSPASAQQGFADVNYFADAIDVIG